MTTRQQQNVYRISGAIALVVVAIMLAALSAPFMVQAFRGPRTITADELRAMQSPGWWNNYVRFTPPEAAQDTQWAYGVKGNEGTKFLLLPVGDERYLFCSARVRNEGPEYIGSLSFLDPAEVDTTVPAEDRDKLLPFGLQAVRSIWFDTGVALVLIAGCLAGAAWLVIEAIMPGYFGRMFAASA